MKKRILLIIVLFFATWVCVLIARYAGFCEYFREQIEGYLVDYSVPLHLYPIIEDNDTVFVNRDQRRLRSLRCEPRDSVVIILLEDSLQNRQGIIRVVHEIMGAQPSSVGLDIIFDNLVSSEEYAEEISRLPSQYHNLVLAFSRPNESDDQVLYPLGVDDYDDIPNLGYTNFGLTGKEVRYLDSYCSIEGETRPAFWTQLWALSHPDKLKNGKLKSKRRFINYNFDINDAIVFEIGAIEDLHQSYLGSRVSPLDLINGKMVIVGWESDDDTQIVPVHDGIHLMPGIKVISVALNTLVFNELSDSFTDKNRDLFVSVIIILLSIGFALLSEFRFYEKWSNVMQLFLGLLLFLVAPQLSMSYDEIWSVFGAVIIFVLIAPAIVDLVNRFIPKNE